MGAAAAQCSGVPCLKLLCKSITEPGMKSTAFEVRQQSFLCWIRKGSFQALHWWLSGLHSSPAVMEEPLRPAGKPRCEQKVHCAPTPGHVRSGWPELTEMIFFSQICADSLFTCGGRTLQEQNHAVMGIISIALRSSALPRRLWGHGSPRGQAAPRCAGPGASPSGDAATGTF